MEAPHMPIYRACSCLQPPLSCKWREQVSSVWSTAIRISTLTDKMDGLSESDSCPGMCYCGPRLSPHPSDRVVTLETSLASCQG
ncbi:hypothetical protein J6590_104799 [Homalodisca vitripennis]|nr:hypothetical protein J6590_104799 [Homalodisca vitripennis]